MTKHLHDASKWKMLRKQLPRRHAATCATQPPVEKIADMLKALFDDVATVPRSLVTLTEPSWTMSELKSAVRRLHPNKSCDEAGLVAELLKHAPDELLQILVELFDHVLRSGIIPLDWRRTVFIMLAKKARACQPSDFRPIAIVRLLYKTFAYMILGRIEDRLDEMQPEARHGFRQGRRIEEHLLTANLMIDKATAHDIPLWIVSLDLSKAFDRVSWSALWAALQDHGVSDHLIWMIQNLYRDQFGEVLGEWKRSEPFDIKAGVRQGCVLSPRLFSCVLEWAMSRWKQECVACGIDLGDGMEPLVDLRFADDILLFATNLPQLKAMMDRLVAALTEVGLLLNADKTVVLTTEAQPPQNVFTDGGLNLKILDRDSAQKWLGCMLSARGSAGQTLDLSYHLQAASRAFFANRCFLLDKHVSVAARLQFFQSVISSVACFASGHRTVHAHDFHRMNVEFRKLVRTVVGPPTGMHWDDPWHDILHKWNGKVNALCAAFSIHDWSAQFLQQYWKLGGYVAKLLAVRWVTRVLNWHPGFARKIGRPPSNWETKLEEFCRFRGLGHWRVAAAAEHEWCSLMDEFVSFCS